MELDTWTISQSYGDIIFETPTNPMHVAETGTWVNPYVTDHIFETRVMHYSGVLGAYFEYWRGSIEWRFKIVKTQFHSGRIEVLWCPGTRPETIDADRVYREVHDLRTTNEFTVKIPYNHSLPWMPTQGGSTGTLMLRVLNPLVAPATVSPNIEILGFFKCGPDFQFAYPTKEIDGFYPVPHHPNPVPNTQSGTFTSTSISRGLDQNARGMGEAILSGRQLLKRYIKWTRVNNDAATNDLPDISENDPLVFESLDYIGLFACFYRWRCGGIRLILTPKPGTPGLLYGVSLTPRANNDDVPSSFAPMAVGWTTLEPMIEVTAPFYSIAAAIPTQVGMPQHCSAQPNGLQQANYYQGNNNVLPLQGVNLGAGTFRSVAEDFSYGYILGPPQMWRLVPIAASSYKDGEVILTKE